MLCIFFNLATESTIIFMRSFLVSFVLSFFSFLFVSAQTWTQIGQDIISDIPPVPPSSGAAALLDHFGDEVAINDIGDIVAISAPNGASSMTTQGITKVFKWDGVNWSQMGQDINALDIGHSGWSITLSSDGYTIAVGEPMPLTSEGLVAVYQYDNSLNTWVSLGSPIYTNLINAFFGKSVSLSDNGSVLAVGAHSLSSGSAALGTLIEWHGAVQVYEYNGISWTQRGSDIVGDLINGGKFGWDVELSSDGNRMIIGASQDPGNGYSGPGYVKVVEWNGSSWNQLGNSIVGESSLGWCGDAVSISNDGNIIAIGEPNYGGSTPGFYSEGSVRAFEWDGAVWNQLGSNLIGDFPTFRFGTSLSLSSSGTRLVVGQEGSLTGGYGSGEVKVFDWNGTSWLQVGQIISGSTEMIALAEDCAINANGNRFIVGVPGYNFNDHIGKMAQVFEFISVISPSFNCTPTGCEDPGDGSGQYSSLADCEAMCSCDLFDSWPTNDPDPTNVPNQNQWCEWCVDYENNGFMNFNPLGLGWGNPDVVCDCCPVLNVYTFNPNSFKIYPNPSKGKFSIFLDLKNNNDDVYLSISNYLGEVVYSEQINIQTKEYNNIIDLRNTASGIYILNITTYNQNINQKIVIH